MCYSNLLMRILFVKQCYKHSITFELIEGICNNKIVKAMPSVKAEINKSQTLVCCNGLVNEQDKVNIKDLLYSIGVGNRIAGIRDGNGL